MLFKLLPIYLIIEDMIKLVKNLLNKLTMYQAMLYFLRGTIALAVILSFFGILPYVWWHILLQLAILIAVCVGANYIFSKIFKIKPNYESQYITAEILTLIVGPTDPIANWQFLVLLGIISMGSKYILAWNRRHVFNPAAFAVVFSAVVLGQGASWWVGNQYLVLFVLLGGLLVVYKLKWFHLTNAFLIVYLLGSAVIAISNGANLAFTYDLLETLVLNSALLFFTFVMLIEPLTAPPGRRYKTLYGALAAILILILQNYMNIYYGFELGLIAANLGAFLVSRNPRFSLTLVNKNQIAANTYLFEFEPLKRFAFKPGQYLEWTLNHSGADTRGSRRFFSIASSPTETNVMLLTKFANPGSSFKKALADMKPGEEILASHLDGDFILPNDDSKLVLIAGGTGIAPFRSMIKNMIDTGSKKDIIFFYTSRTEADFALKDLFAQAEEFGVKAHYIATDKEGFITPELIKKEVSDFMDRKFYVSGPEPMVEAYEKMLYAMGIPKNKVTRDYFEGYTETYTK